MIIAIERSCVQSAEIRQHAGIGTTVVAAQVQVRTKHYGTPVSSQLFFHFSSQLRPAPIVVVTRNKRTLRNCTRLGTAFYTEIHSIVKATGIVIGHRGTSKVWRDGHFCKRHNKGRGIAIFSRLYNIPIFIDNANTAEHITILGICRQGNNVTRLRIFSDLHRAVSDRTCSSDCIINIFSQR